MNVSGLYIPGTDIAADNYFLAVFDNANTVNFEPTKYGDIPAWNLFVLADDLLQPHPVTQTKVIEYKEGMEHFFAITMTEPDSVRARAFACGLHPLQIRSVLHTMQATALSAIGNSNIPEPPPAIQSGPPLLVVRGHLQ